MARADSVQLNVRSRYARERAAWLAERTGMTTTQVIEEALRAYLPPPQNEVPARLMRKGAILVKPASGRKVSLADADAALDEVRSKSR